MKILYIPFSLEDSESDLLIKAMKWKESYAIKGKEVVIAHHAASKEEQDILQKTLQEKSPCKIYILSHGINSPDLVVCNQTTHNEFYKDLSISDVAARFKQDLITPEFSDQHVVKLFFCDEYAQDNKAHQMAVKFREALGEAYQKLEVEYYTDVSISRPGASSNELMGSKKALRQFQVTNALFCFNLSCVVGNAKSYRQGLNVATAPMSFFESEKHSSEKIKYPNFTHPLLAQLAAGLVATIQRDPILSKYQGTIIADLFASLPLKISDYLVDSLIIRNSNILLELRINKQKLVEFLIKSGVIKADELNDSTAAPKEKASAWIDPDDFLGAGNLSFTRFAENVHFGVLEDFDELHEETVALARPKI